MRILVTTICFFLMSGGALAYDFEWSDEGSVSPEEDALAESVVEPAGTVRMEGQFLDGDLFELTVIAEKFESPVLGISFHLLFDSQILAFLRYEPADFLERGGDPFYLVKNDQGEVVFGETLRRDDSFPVGGGRVAKFYFQMLRQEEFGIEFGRGVVSTLDVVRQDIDRVKWQNGDFKKGGRIDGAGKIMASVSAAGSKNLLGFVVAGMALIVGGLAILLIRKSNKRFVNFK